MNDILNSKEFKKLKTFFDIVELNTSNEKYNLLVCANKINKPNNIIKYETWFNLKIRKSSTKNKIYVSHTDIELIEGCIEDLVLWLPLLEKIEKPIQQLSLFDERETVVLEKEPTAPSSSEESAWSGYLRKQDGVKRRNLMKQYSFMELFDFTKYWAYKDVDYSVFAPSYDELIEIIKKGILKYLNSPGRHSDVWNDNSYNYINGDGPLADYELFSRFAQCYRFFISAYKEYGHIGYDLSYTIRQYKEQESYRFYFQGTTLTYETAWYDEEPIKYDLLNKEFISWLREIFKVEATNHIDDTEMTNMVVREFFMRIDNGFDIKKIKYTSKSEFKKYVNEKINNKSLSGSSAHSPIDGYTGFFHFYGSKSSISLEQYNKARSFIGYPIPENFKDSDRTEIIKYENLNQIIDKAYEIIEQNYQPTLF